MCSQSRPTSSSEKVNVFQSSRNTIDEQNVSKIHNQILESNPFKLAPNSNGSHGIKIFKEMLKKMKIQKTIKRREAPQLSPAYFVDLECIQKIHNGTATSCSKKLECIHKLHNGTVKPCEKFF